MTIPTAATIALALSHMPSEVLAAANSSLIGFGSISHQNLAYKPMLDAKLIHLDGSSAFELEDLLSALSFEINKRLDNGDFE